MSLGAAPGGSQEAVTDLDTLDGLDAHESGRKLRIELAIPVNVGAEPGRNTVGQHLDDPAQGVTVVVGTIDLRNHEG